MRTVYINGDIIRRRRQQLGPHSSIRAFARLCGLTGTRVRTLETSHQVQGSLTLAQLRRIADTLGVDMADLIRNPATPAADDPTDDASLLGRVLAQDLRLTSKAEIARVLGWTLPQVTTAQEVLDAQLRTTGLRVHELHGGICLRSIDNIADAATDAIQERRNADNGMNVIQGRIVAELLAGTFTSNAVTEAEQPHLSELMNLGLVFHHPKGGSRSYRLTEDAAFAFNVT